MLAACGVRRRESADLGCAVPHALRRREPQRVCRESLVPEDVPLDAPHENVLHPRVSPVADRRNGEEPAVDVRVVLLELAGRVVDRPPGCVLAVVARPLDVPRVVTRKYVESSGLEGVGDSYRRLEGGDAAERLAVEGEYLGGLAPFGFVAHAKYRYVVDVAVVVEQQDARGRVVGVDLADVEGMSGHVDVDPARVGELDVAAAACVAIEVQRSRAELREPLAVLIVAVALVFGDYAVRALGPHLAVPGFEHYEIDDAVTVPVEGRRRSPAEAGVSVPPLEGYGPSFIAGRGRTVFHRNGHDGFLRVSPRGKDDFGLSVAVEVRCHDDGADESLVPLVSMERA